MIRYMSYMSPKITTTAVVALLLALPSSSFAAVDFRVTVGGTDRKIVVFEDDVSDEEKEAVLESAGETTTIQSLDSIDAKVVVTSTETSKEALLASGRVKRVDEDVEVYALARRTPAQVLPWGIERVGAPLTWSRSTGSGVRVAVLDSGIDLDHPDLVRNIHGGVNTLVPSRSADDDNGHGTHVAGIIAAVNNATGSVGVAVDASLYAVKVLDRRGAGYISDIIEGLDWAVANNMHVVNLSLGTEQHIPSLQEAIDRTVRAGVLVVAAAGNNGKEVLYPARYEGVIAVGMVNDEGQIHRSSSRGSALDIVAPGVNVYSTYKSGKYRDMTGTSMAAPHVAGAAALLLGAPQFCDADGDARCSVTELSQRLTSTASDLGSAGRDDVFGAGMVSATRALGL